jgi:serine/threonine protein kinase
MAHVLFLDIVGFSKLPINEEREILRELQQTVSGSFEFVRAQKRSQLISLPTGDGMALVFFGDLESPAKCALELSRTIHERSSRLKLRMGVHTGPVYRIADINSNRNVAGGGINIAQRVMDCGDAGHILLSGTAAEMLSQVDLWNSKMHDLGEVEVKHGQIIRLFNLYGPEFGNPEVPEKVKGRRKAPEFVGEFTASMHDDAMIGQQFSHYKILKQLGKGGMGVVYQAQDHRLGRLVALKFLPESHSSNRSSLERFLQEARTAATLNHPNICTVHDIGSYQRQNFIVMELLQGETLKHLIGERRLPPEEIVRYCVQIADALECAHSAGIVHRDIKPANIFVTSRGQVKVLDFGLAKITPMKTHGASKSPSNTTTTTEDSNLTGPGELVGTVSYMSPEQARGRALDCRTDLFSFGVVLYEMATGLPPFRGETSAVVFEALLNRAPVSPMQFNPDLAPGLERVMNKALEKDPAARYQSAAEMRTDLQQGLTSGPPPSILEPDSSKKDLGEVALLYKRNVQLDEQVLNLLEHELRKQGYRIFVDRHIQVGMEWAREIERRVAGASAVIVLLSAAAVNSEMLAYELQIAQESARKRGKPCILPVRINFDAALPGSLASVLDALQYSQWRSAEDNESLVSAILTSLKNPPAAVGDSLKVEAVGGAVPLDSRFYVARPTDDELYEALGRKDSVILIKGARQMGKTSLMARGLQKARRAGAKIVFTDFQKLNSLHLENVEKLFLALAGSVADQLEIDANPADCWSPRRGPSMNFERFIKREVLIPLSTSLIWGMDEIDRLFSCDFGTEVFGLFRSWHNERSLDPDGPFKKLTLAIAYATEAHMFIKDMNQSPFNVGTLLVLTDFTPAQLSELNKRYGCPLKDQSEINQFYDLVGGQPYLTRRGLNELTSRKCRFSDLASRAADDGGPFGDHLRRLLVSLAEDAALQDAVKGMLTGKRNASQDTFYRLRTSGLVAGESARDMKPRCKLYEDYLTLHAF